ncbi:unnamed protein product [Scytosiphon promiscuus]
MVVFQPCSFPVLSTFFAQRILYKKFRGTYVKCLRVGRMRPPRPSVDIPEVDQTNTPADPNVSRTLHVSVCQALALESPLLCVCLQRTRCVEDSLAVQQRLLPVIFSAFSVSVARFRPKRFSLSFKQGGLEVGWNRHQNKQRRTPHTNRAGRSRAAALSTPSFVSQLPSPTLEGEQSIVKPCQSKRDILGATARLPPVSRLEPVPQRLPQVGTQGKSTNNTSAPIDRGIRQTI